MLSRLNDSLVGLMMTMVFFQIVVMSTTTSSTTTAAAFQASRLSSLRRRMPRTRTLLRENDTSQVEAFLAERFPNFSNIVIGSNENVWKELRKNAPDGYTIFAPNDGVFEQLGEKKCSQLTDPRNLETTEKIGAYHAVNEPVTAEELFNSGGVITLGGEVPVDRSVSGGFFGVGGKEDGGVTLNGAKVLGSAEVDNCIIHEVDKLISPQILWRYVDQLRIPGSN